jgi:prepilin signal peptidase PulO-like enzyme (type II secretory pathway)
MIALPYIFIFILGLTVGSFLNCLIYRLEIKKNFLKGRSFCPKCKHFLSWLDLIPLLSFLILRGRCRYCGKKISFQYPLVETATGLIFLLIFSFPRLWQDSAAAGQFSIFNKFSIFNFQTLNLFYYLSLASFLIVVFVYDLKHFIIPNKVIYPAITGVLVYRLFGILNFSHWNLFGNWKLEIGNFGTVINSLSAALAGAFFFLIIVLASRGRWMGMGDVKLAFLMGLFLGFPKIIVALFFAFLIGAAVGIGLIIVRKKTFKSEVPFGPFLVSGTFIALFWAEIMINWYLNLFKV